MKFLDLSTNLIFDPFGLNYLENLVYLNLQSNSINSLFSLESLFQIEELDISNNKISLLESLLKLKKLRKLNIGYNPIDYQELIKIKRALPDCEISFEYYSEDKKEAGRVVEIVLCEDIVFMFDYYNNQNRSFYWMSYIKSPDNKTTKNTNIIMNDFIKTNEISLFRYLENQHKKQYISDDEELVSCIITYE